MTAGSLPPAVLLLVICCSTYLWQTRVPSIDYHPANLNDLRTIFCDVDAMLVTRGGDVEDDILVELLRSGTRERGGRGRVLGLSIGAGPL